MAKQSKTHQTQWAGQFGVAYELTRRGYLVAFTMGNAPGTDLLCEAPSGGTFPIQVKSLSGKTCFPYQEKLRHPGSNRSFVFVVLPVDVCERPQYFVLDQEQFLELAKEQDAMDQEAERKRQKPYASWSYAIQYSLLARREFRDAWHNLPK